MPNGYGHVKKYKDGTTEPPDVDVILVIGKETKRRIPIHREFLEMGSIFYSKKLQMTLPKEGVKCILEDENATEHTLLLIESFYTDVLRVPTPNLITYLRLYQESIRIHAWWDLTSHILSRIRLELETRLPSLSSMTFPFFQRGLEAVYTSLFFDGTQGIPYRAPPLGHRERVESATLCVLSLSLFGGRVIDRGAFPPLVSSISMG